MTTEQNKLKISKEGELLLIILPKLLDYDNVDEVRLECEQALGDKPQQVVVDFQEVGYTDSSGLGLMINLHKAVAAYGGRMTLAHVPAEIRKTLAHTCLDAILEIARRLNAPHRANATQAAPPQPRLFFIPLYSSAGKKCWR